MREKTNPLGRNKSTNTTPPPPSQSTEISSVDTEESNTTCWEKCCSCCRRKNNKKSPLVDTEIAALMDQYEYVVEKLHIVKVPLLLCGTEEDMRERLNKLNTYSKKTTGKSLSNEDWECLPFPKTFHPVYFVQEDTHPSVTEIFSRVNELNRNPDGEFTRANVSTEVLEQTAEPTVETRRISRDTVTSHRFAMIPPEREPGPKQKETVTVHFTVSNSENKNEIEEGIWEKPEYTVESIHSIRPQQSKRSKTESVKYDSYKNDYPQSRRASQITASDYPQSRRASLITASDYPQSRRASLITASDYPQSRRASQITASDLQEYYDEYRSSYHSRDLAPVHDSTRRLSQSSYTSRTQPEPSLESQANRPSNAKRRDSITDPRRLSEQESPIFRSIPPPSHTLPSTSRTPPPSSSEPRPSTSRNQSGTPPPKGPDSHFNPLLLSSSTSSDIVSILSSKPSVKSVPLSKDSDVLIEEGKPEITEDTSQKKVYVDVSGKHLPKSEVHKILNKYSSIFVENLKDPVPKDPLTLPKDDEKSQARQTISPPMDVQSSRRPVVAEAITEKPRKKTNQPLAQVTTRTEPPQSSRPARSPSAHRRTSSGGTVEPVDPVMYDTSPPHVPRISGNNKHRDCEPSTHTNATEIRKSIVQQQGFHERAPKPNYKGEHSYSRKRRSSKDERAFVVEEDMSVELGCHDLTNENDKVSTSSDELRHLGMISTDSCKHFPSKPQTIYHMSGHNDHFQDQTLPTTSALRPQQPVSVHSKRCNEQMDKPTEEYVKRLSTGETVCAHPCPHHPDEHERICTGEHDSTSDLQNTNVIKHWKIIIKQHKDIENETSAGESDH